jgi:UDPglucose 6-dehydrogenase
MKVTFNGIGYVALLIHTEWQNIRALDFELIKEKLSTNAFFDGCNMLATNG